MVQRLFGETRRLEERRFEGQERKRMGEEEAYARTCTFEVREEQHDKPYVLRTLPLSTEIFSG